MVVILLLLVSFMDVKIIVVFVGIFFVFLVVEWFGSGLLILVIFCGFWLVILGGWFFFL